MPDDVTLFPLGGLGEIGMNCLCISSGDSMVMVDCGLMFPEDYLFGVNTFQPTVTHLLFTAAGEIDPTLIEECP